MTGKPLFDLDLLAQRRNRAVGLGFAGRGDFLHRDTAEEIAERVSEINRPFTDVGIVGSGGGVYRDALAAPDRQITQIEISPVMSDLAGVTPGLLDPLPFGPGTLDMIVSGLWLHWSNDPVGQLIQMRRALRPDGLMIATLFGGQTLVELREVLTRAEAEISGGLSPRVAPMAELRDLGALLQRANFAMPVADSRKLDVTFASLRHLMQDLRAMGETNILRDRLRHFTRRAIFERAEEIYRNAFSNPDGRVRATFDVIYLTGWAPAENQPKPKRPGSAGARLADALGTVEQSAGEQTGPRRR